MEVLLGVQHSFSKKRRALLYLHALQPHCVGVMHSIPCSLAKGSAARKAGCAACNQDTRENVERTALSFLRAAACEGRRLASWRGWCLVCSALPCWCSECLRAACRCAALGRIGGLTRKLRGQVPGVTFVLGDISTTPSQVLGEQRLVLLLWAPRLRPRLVLTMILFLMLVQVDVVSAGELLRQ